MEANMFFTGSILLLCLIHGVTVAGRMAGRLFGGPSSTEGKKKPAHAQRDDWYLFFHCADLTGNKQAEPVMPAKQASASQGTVLDKSGNKRATRMYARL